MEMAWPAAKHKTGIRRKAVFTICLSLAIIVILATVFTYLFGFTTFRNIVGREYAQMARLLGAYVTDELRGEIEDISTYATRPLWLDMVKEADQSYKGQSDDAIQRWFAEMDSRWISAGKDDPLIRKYTENRAAVSMQAILATRPNIVELFITDRYGGLVAAVDKTSDFYQADEEWWQKAYNNGRGAIFIGDVELDKSSGLWGLSIATAMKDENGQVIGICKEFLSLKRLFGKLQNFHIGKTGHAVIADRTGVIIFHPGISIPDSKLRIDLGSRPAATTSRSYANVPATHLHKDGRFLAFSKIAPPTEHYDGPGWTIFIDQETRETFAPINSFVEKLIAIMSALMFLTIPVGLIFGNMIVSPIQKLHNATEKIASGNWDYRTSIKTGDEIEQLADAFFSMVDHIKQKQNELVTAKDALEKLSQGLEQKIEDRTKDLRHVQEATLNILEDLTEAKDKLSKYAAELEGALKIKSDFTSTVSHELRTPLAAIKESIAIVLDGSGGPLNKEQAGFLDMAKRNVDRLARLINDILDFQKLESGKMVFKIEEGDLNQTVTEVAQTMQRVAESKGLKLGLTLGQNLPTVRFDKDKITQVLANLLNNAIKFTDKGGITISTVCRNDNTVVVSVCDTGVGIRKEDLSKLFQPFEQIDKGIERKTGGTGLGLAISKDIISKHNGKIWADSEFGQGSTFRFILPVKERRLHHG